MDHILASVGHLVRKLHVVVDRLVDLKGISFYRHDAVGTELTASMPYEL